MDHLSNDHKDCPNQHKNNHKLYNETNHPAFLFAGKSTETKTTTWSDFPNGGKAFVEQIIVSEYTNKSKRPGLWESQSGIQVGKLIIWERSF